MGESFNLAFEESFVLKELLEKIKENVSSLNEIKFNKNANTLYPSVNCGPIDISKAIRSLKWTPTKLVYIFIFINFSCK